jgi:Carboxypeptidase regulatory-like domain/TonB dependent receptor
VIERIGHALSRSLRGIIGMALVIALLASIAAPTLADTTTGNISGTVTANGQPVSGVLVTAVAPSGRYTARTDAKGFFGIVGVTPDTYNISFTRDGYTAGAVNGVTVNPTQTTTVNQTLTSAQLKTIGSTTSRASGVSAFQPQQPEDTYSVNANQIQTILGKSHAQSETSLIISLPGASLDSNGYPVLRGGRENDEGFQFEGIDYTDAFTHQFVNSLAINGVQNFQLSPGAGDASVGNVGTGQINATVKRGTRPAFGSFEADAHTPVYEHLFAGEYGWATPTGTISSYTSFEGANTGGICGRTGTDCNLVGLQIFNNYTTGRDLIENAVFKFGRDNRQSLQLFYQNQQFNFYENTEFLSPQNLLYRVSQPDFAFYWGPGTTGLSQAEIRAIQPFEFGQTALNQQIRRPAHTFNQPNETLKLQYSNSLNQSTFMTVKAYKVNAATLFDFPYRDQACQGFGFVCDDTSIQGGQRTGFSADFTKQIGAKHLIGFGGKYEFVHPIDSFQSAGLGMTNLLGGEANGFGSVTAPFADFLPGTDPNCGGAVNFGPGNCYLASFYPGGQPPRIPDYNQAPFANRHDTGFYVQDQFQATDKLKINAGLRVDNSSFDYPTDVHTGAFNDPGGVGYTSALYLPIATGVYTSGPLAGQPNPALDRYATDVHRTSSTLQPRFGVAYQYNPRNSITFNYGRSVELPPIAFVDARVPRSQYAAFKGIPSDVNICGPTGDRACRDYADQVYWANQNFGGGVPINPTKPSEFNNYDMSLQHDFGSGLSAKLTPFYRRGYDVLASFAFPLIQNGQPVLDTNGNPITGPTQTSNLGTSFTTGVEFYMTKTATYGLSGSLSLTYLNEFTNVVPLSVNEDFFPSIPAVSLFQGNLYRVGFVSPFNGVLALQYKWRSGWRVNPIIGFNDGYPIGAGLITPFGLGGKNFNLPSTNLTSQAGSVGASQYVDPANPGSVFHPNVAASRGTPEKNSPGGVLSAPRVNIANIDFEYNKPGTKNTFGLLVANVFNQIYSQPAFNPRYQPVATGISGPRSGSTSGAALFPQLGYRNYASFRGNNQPYLLTPSGTPTEYRFYYQLSL